MSAEIRQLRRHALLEGDVVRLKSGGPLMLVAIADGEISWDCQCVWTDQRRLQTESFSAVTLDLIAKGVGHG